MLYALSLRYHRITAGYEACVPKRVVKFVRSNVCICVDEFGKDFSGLFSFLVDSRSMLARRKFVALKILDLVCKDKMSYQNR